MTKSESWAKHYMRENRNTQFRAEQIELYKQLRTIRANSSIIMEYYIMKGKFLIAVVDIADLTRKECFRLNGPIHVGRTEKDDAQKTVLEELGWKVTDIET